MHSYFLSKIASFLTYEGHSLLPIGQCNTSHSLDPVLLRCYPEERHLPVTAVAVKIFKFDLKKVVLSLNCSGVASSELALRLGFVFGRLEFISLVEPFQRLYRWKLQISC